MSNQKFQRGNLVYISKDLGEMMGHFKCDRNAIIRYSYCDKYSSSTTDHSYSVMFEDGSTSAWYEEDKLTFVEEGGEHLLEKARAVFDEEVKQLKDFNYIVPNLDKEEISSETILFLFDKLGFKTSFHDNGEYFLLFKEWAILKPIFNHIKNSKSIVEAKSIFKNGFGDNFNVELIFNEFKKAMQ